MRRTISNAMMRLAIIPLILFGSLCAASAADITGQDLDIPATERMVHTTVFRAPGDAPRPAVLILHGAGGFDRRLTAYHTYAAALANEGFDAYLIYYYSAADRNARSSVFAKRYEAWARLVDDVAAYVRGFPTSNGKVGLIGFSNGGILATGASAIDPGISAAVIFYGTAPWPLQTPPQRFPPLLILHGDADTIIPVDQGRNLAALAKRLGGPADLVIYPGARHGFGIDTTDATGADAFQRTLAFLKTNLSSSPSK